jgi:hypothetical protein
MNEITIGDKVYISAKRAAEITGYARDYVGQLCREGHIDAKMVGRSWYVYEPSIRAHRFGPETVSAPEAVEPLVIEPTQPEVPEEVAETPKYTSEVPDLLPELTPVTLEELLPPAEETLTDMQTAWREWFDQKQKVLEVPEIETPEIIDARNEAYEAEEELTEEPEESFDEEEEENSHTEGISVPLQRIEEETHAVEDSTREEVVPIHHFEPVPVAPIPTYTPSQAMPMDIRRDIAVEDYSLPVPQGRVIQERVITKKAGNTTARRNSKGSNAPIIAVLIGISLLSITIAFIGTGYASRYLKTLPAENNPVINFLLGSQKIDR